MLLPILQINSSIRNTREVVRILDECSYRLMCHDQQYHMLRRAQLSKQLTRTEDQLENLLSMQDYQRLCAVVKAHRSDLFSRIRDEQRKAVDCLRKVSLYTHCETRLHTRTDIAVGSYLKMLLVPPQLAVWLRVTSAMELNICMHKRSKLRLKV